MNTYQIRFNKSRGQAGRGSMDHVWRVFENGKEFLFKNLDITGSKSFGTDFSLTDHTGKRRTLEDFRGKVVVMFFGYTHCPDVCPTELQNMTLALDELSERERAKVQPLFITIDPERDTPAVLKEYMTNFHPAFRALTGSDEQVRGAIRAYRAYAAKAKETAGSGDYLMDHSSFIYLMDGKGEYLTHFRPGQKETEIARTIRSHL